jgi:hypothetical protein
VLEIDGKLFQVMKQQYTQGRGRQLGNVDVRPAVTDAQLSVERSHFTMRPSDEVAYAVVTV